MEGDVQSAQQVGGGWMWSEERSWDRKGERTLSRPHPFRRESLSKGPVTGEKNINE